MSGINPVPPEAPLMPWRLFWPEVAIVAVSTGVAMLLLALMIEGVSRLVLGHSWGTWWYWVLTWIGAIAVNIGSTGKLRRRVIGR